MPEMEESTRGVKFFTIVVFLCLAFADVSGSSEQPLADIAIHKATRALSEAVSIFASPQLLGLQVEVSLPCRKNIRFLLLFQFFVEKKKTSGRAAF